MITESDLYTSEQILEMREMQVSFPTFRENLLLNESMEVFVMNLILFGTSFFEMLMVASAFLAACIPFLLAMAFVFTRKQDFCKALVLYMSAKIWFFFWNDDVYKFHYSEKLYICGVDGQLYESFGCSE